MNFESLFKALTGNDPFRWQEALFRRLMQGQDKFPASCNLPTGLGKTSVLPIWLSALALAEVSVRIPRRLVYVVNRRTVVDQATREAESLRDRLLTPADHAKQQEVVLLQQLAARLEKLCAVRHDSPLAISTLRGQFADNGEWTKDPARPAIIVGTVDMIGSRLLFSGYGRGFKTRPLHAGLLGQDTLLVHDEAHLEPAFQRLLEAIYQEQREGRTRDFRPLHVMALSATSRAGTEQFELTPEESDPPSTISKDASPTLRTVWQRLGAKKGMSLHGVKRSEIVNELARQALRHQATDNAVLVFARTVEDVKKLHAALTSKKGGVAPDQVAMLTGTLRGLERDQLVDTPVFRRFLPQSKREPNATPQPAMFLICTSAGEVGIDISADHLVCDLTPLDSMAQRLGRVNRRGEGQAEVDVVYEDDPDTKQQDNLYEKARWETLQWLGELPPRAWDNDRRDASPLALRALMRRMTLEERDAAFTPTPAILPATDILFDAWALTSIREELPGRPPVADWLHGVADWQPPETSVAWRMEVDLLDEKLFAMLDAEELLEDYPLKPHEVLKDSSSRVFGELKKLAERYDGPVWLIDQRDRVRRFNKLSELVSGDKNVLDHATVLLGPNAGGLSNGLLVASAAYDPTRGDYDVADQWFVDKQQPFVQRRKRILVDEPNSASAPDNMRLVRRIDLRPGSDDEEPSEESETEVQRYWLWYVRPRSADDEGSKLAFEKQPLEGHLERASKYCLALAKRLMLTDGEKHSATLSGAWHDLGKDRHVWQRSIGNAAYPSEVLAKSGGRMRSRDLGKFRHEFGSLLDLMEKPEFAALSLEDRELLLHVVAAHHGRARPHFSTHEAFDPGAGKTEAMSHDLAKQVPRRFAQLQRKYGRWGLAYLESILRAADALASMPEEENGHANH